MVALLKLLMLIIIMTPYLVGVLFVFLTSVIYVIGYVYDSVFGNTILKIGHFIGKEIPSIKEDIFIIKCWQRIQPKKLYLRYETPLFTYCFSYTAILLLTVLLPVENGMGIILASVLYLIFYFVGMARKCGKDKRYYGKILSNNMQFLKLSFLPVGFIITILGFLFTITGKKVQDFPFDFSMVQNAIANLTSYNNETDLLRLLFKLFVIGILLLVLLYIASLPVQVLAYFVISIINYFRKNKRAYAVLFGKYMRIVGYLLKSIWWR